MKSNGAKLFDAIEKDHWLYCNHFTKEFINVILKSGLELKTIKNVKDKNYEKLSTQELITLKYEYMQSLDSNAINIKAWMKANEFQESEADYYFNCAVTMGGEPETTLHNIGRDWRSLTITQWDLLKKRVDEKNHENATLDTGFKTSYEEDEREDM